ncbi:MAG TPA: CehA/McbA family metallohydrolase [Chryseolinea sp.]
MKKWLIAGVLMALIVFHNAQGQKEAAPVLRINIDPAKKFQRIDGFGVNANTRSWNGKELEPALNLLLDTLHANIWRVIVESVEKWEDKNDNDDPFVFNWNYYNYLYETEKFQKVWEMIRYLNNRGITDRLMINFMGYAPPWMGIKVIKPQYEDEFVEMITSFFYYALRVKNLKFGLIAPTNETEHHNYPEGPHLDGKQHARIIRKLIDRMEGAGIMGDIKIVAPDNASPDKSLKDFIPPLMDDSVVMNKIFRFGFHSYGGYPKGLQEWLLNARYPTSTYWVTEWNAWCQGCDEGKLGEYDYNFASKSLGYLLDMIQHGASAGIAWEGYDSYYEHHAPSPFSYWGMLAYDFKSKTYHPRKNFYAIQQISRFVNPGAIRIFNSNPGDSINASTFYDSALSQLTVVGINKSKRQTTLHFDVEDARSLQRFELYYTNETDNVRKSGNISIDLHSIKAVIPPNCIFTLTGKAELSKASSLKPEPAGWFSGDIHVHRNCGGKDVLAVDKLPTMMEHNDLAVISLLADMGNGEVLDSQKDLPKVNGSDAPESTSDRIIHWDAEWHWDATYSNFEHQALGGHLVLLGLKEAHQIWDESPYKILEWARKQNAISGFCHFEYLNDQVQSDLNCCIPMEYPVEAALGTIDFISEDVYGTISPNNGTYNSEAAIHAYYKLLNCGFRLGYAAGTDYPCNNNEPLGTLLTYVDLGDNNLTYQNWIEGIKNGKTVVSRNGHDEFIDFKVNGQHGPGSEIKLKQKGNVSLEVTWTARKELKGKIELVSNGIVIATLDATAKPGTPIVLKTTVEIAKSAWICARRMDDRGHQTHSAPVYIIVDEKPIRASAADAQFFMTWIDNLLKKTSAGGSFARYFTHDLDKVQGRYRKAREIYDKIRVEAQAGK